MNIYNIVVCINMYERIILYKAPFSYENGTFSLRISSTHTYPMKTGTKNATF